MTHRTMDDVTGHTETIDDADFCRKLGEAIMACDTQEELTVRIVDGAVSIISAGECVWASERVN